MNQATLYLEVKGHKCSEAFAACSGQDAVRSSSKPTEKHKLESLTLMGLGTFQSSKTEEANTVLSRSFSTTTPIIPDR